MHFLRVAGQHLDEHIRQNPQTDCRSNIAGERAEQDHDERSETALEVGEVHLRKAGQHGEANKDQRHAGDSRRDH